MCLRRGQPTKPEPSGYRYATQPECGTEETAKTARHEPDPNRNPIRACKGPGDLRTFRKAGRPRDRDQEQSACDRKGCHQRTFRVFHRYEVDRIIGRLSRGAE